jgi:ABC-2 type transport system permease protein
MRNVVAIAQRELRAYFSSPIAYVAVGLFGLIFGLMYGGIVNWFAEQSQGMGMGMGPQTMNINQQLIRPLVMNMSVVFLFVLPIVTMRTYSEEKRSGTMELLLTSPLTDLQIVLGKFFGALAVYVVLLVVSAVHVGLLFWYGAPDWRPVLSAYLGMLLFGGSFIALGLFLSSLTSSQVVAGLTTFGLALVLWIINWIAPALDPTGQSILTYLSMTEHLDDFVKGVIDTKHLMYYISFIAFGLFLTARSVDVERWRG